VGTTTLAGVHRSRIDPARLEREWVVLLVDAGVSAILEAGEPAPPKFFSWATRGVFCCCRTMVMELMRCIGVMGTADAALAAYDERRASVPPTRSAMRAVSSAVLALLRRRVARPSRLARRTAGSCRSSTVGRRRASQLGESTVTACIRAASLRVRMVLLALLGRVLPLVVALLGVGAAVLKRAIAPGGV